MGLDMYLHQRKHFSCFDFKKQGNHKAEKITITIVRDFGDSKQTEEIVAGTQYGGINVDIPVAYWRKVNCVHRYFLEHTGTEVDDCKPIVVRGDIVKELVDTCKKILADHSKAEELLPTQEGFFFGSTEYDEYYFADIEDIIKQLENLDFDTDYIYEASW